MTNKQIVFIALTGIMLGSLVYVTATIPNADMPETTSEFRPKHLWLVVTSFSGIVLWFWALYDWGTREIGKISRLLWLLLLIFTMSFGAIIYFVFVGLREDSRNIGLGARRDPGRSPEIVKG